MRHNTIERLITESGFIRFTSEENPKTPIDWSCDYTRELERFAELIVRECARIARATPCPYEDEELKQRLGHTWDMAAAAAGRGIVKHFGVRE